MVPLFGREPPCTIGRVCFWVFHDQDLPSSSPCLDLVYITIACEVLVFIFIKMKFLLHALGWRLMMCKPFLLHVTWSSDFPWKMSFWWCACDLMMDPHVNLSLDHLCTLIFIVFESLNSCMLVSWTDLEVMASSLQCSWWKVMFWLANPFTVTFSSECRIVFWSYLQFHLSKNSDP